MDWFISLALMLLSFQNFVFCQGPSIEWQNTIGGTDDDYPNRLV